MTVEALYQANSGTYGGMSTGGASGMVNGRFTRLSTLTWTSGRTRTTLGGFVSPPQRRGLLRTRAGRTAKAVFLAAIAIFCWAVATDQPEFWAAILIPGAVALWTSRLRQYFTDRASIGRRLEIWREFLVCVPCNTAFLSAQSTQHLGLAVPGWRVPVNGLHIAVTRLATKGH
ncbi:hypothetical protein JNUCC64_15685 [Streptomyces sp. JNUCC 64]